MTSICPLQCGHFKKEKDKLIIREEYPQIPPKVEYRLSERGKSTHCRLKYDVCMGPQKWFCKKVNLRGRTLRE